MIEIFSGLRSQIKNLKDRLKALDTSKKTQKEVKEVVDALNALEERYAKEKAKRDEKKKLKETQNEKAPEESKEAPKETVEASESTDVTKESADVIPELGTDWGKVLEPKRDTFTSSHGKSCDCVECLKKKNVVDRVEKGLGSAIIGFKQDDVVKPARGSESLGRVIRCDATEENPAGLVYVFWDSGSLKDRDVAGGYYAADLVKHSAEEKPKEEPKCPCYEDKSVYCPKCKSLKTSDLKSNYMAMLQDLKDEREAHYNQGNHPWVVRLDQKIKDLEAKIQELFGNEKQADIATQCDMCKKEICPDCGKCHECNKITGSEIDHPSGTERLVTIDQTPPGDKANYGPDGKPSESEYQDELAMPSGSNRTLNAANTCAICKEEFKSWPEYNAHRLTKHKPDVVKQPINPSTKVSAFNREWNITHVEKEGSHIYDVHDTDGRKVMSLKPSNNKQWSEAELKAALQNEMTMGFKQAKLVDKIAFLNEGTKVIVLATSKDKKQVKIANLEHSVRAWVPSTKIKLLALDGQSVAHEGHQDKVLAIHETETLVECPTMGVHWEKKEIKLPTHDKPTTPPPATPESLNPDVTAAKDCPDCHGNFVGAEGEKCSTCGGFSVTSEDESCVVCKKPLAPLNLNPVKEEFYGKHVCPQCSEKTALKTALPPTIPNQRGYLDNPPVDKQADLNKIAYIEKRPDGYYVRSEKGKNLGGPYKSREAAEKRLKQVHYFKWKGSSLRPFSKKAEVLTDPYAALQTQVQTLRDRMSLVQERLQSNPLPKEAGEGEKDNSEIDVPALLEDLTMGIDLLETKLQGDDVEQDVHPAIEEMENLLWSVEEKLGITPNLSEEEKAEPEHTPLVKELDKESAVSCPSCGARLQDRKTGAKCEECGKPVPEDLIVKEAAPIPTDSSTSPVAPAPLLQDIRPTDEDNLEISVVKPTSPPAPGQIWVFDTEGNKYVSMPDPNAPNKTI